MIERLWLQPPLAFARLGSSTVPCDNYRWGPSDLTPHGTGKTTVVPDLTLDLGADGTLSARMPERVQFKDSAGWRPVCPYFEVHGSWTVDGKAGEGPLTERVLADSGLSLADIRWEVSVANLKAYHLTQQEGDRIEARVEVAGDDNQRHVLAGVSPQDEEDPLVPSGTSLPLGAVQLPVPNPELPGLRLRFTPGSGFVYGPTDLPDPRSEADYDIPAGRRILNPDSGWVGFVPPETDPRTAPGDLFAGAELGRSVGLVDDVCDGTVTVRLPGGLSATARIVAGPPDFTPDRRPFVSLADGLADRLKRDEVRQPGFLEDEQTVLEIRDLFERVLETMNAVNVDVQNERSGGLNARIAPALNVSPTEARALAFEPPQPLLGLLLGLSERGRRRHRRFVALEVLEDMLREQPDLISRWIRPPAVPAAEAGASLASSRFYTRQMPSGMRGSDAYPLHLTRRQYDLLVGWAARLSEDTEPNT
ncbi:hypothetical protein [Streptomyces sp. P17]|uniref:hypothetical protein n=1 Tax=Streptomyces sp. P17 TaxID=3074716 RepID=UPI0028F41FB3|nr:hypothetical protein [Streptomyces sp. P17]MDT9698411.1 hypothetical protein [Streptomyces sp. P17]